MNLGVGTQLRGWDAATFRTANGDPSMRSTVVALAVLDKSPDWPRLRERLIRLTLCVPALRMRPLYGVSGLSAPRLAVDPDFDLDVHVHRYRLPEGAGWQQVLDDARRMSLTDFDQHRPLWEIAVVDGLPAGEAALLFKLHHSIADGQATVGMAQSLFERGVDPDPDEQPAPVAPAAADAGIRDVTLANLADDIRRATELAVATVRGALDLTKGTITDPTATWSRLVHTATSVFTMTGVSESAMSPVMSGRGTTYSFASFEMPFSGMRNAARANSVNVNDAFLAGVSGAFDAYHRRHGVVVDELRVNVPISLRGGPGDRTGREANAVGIARFLLPVADLSVAERMKASQALVARWRSDPALRMADPLAEVSWIVPVPMLAQAARASDVTTSNVPGPPVPLYVAGARMVAAYPLVATIGSAVNVTMVTYAGSIFVGISADDRAVEDLPALVEDLRMAFIEVTGGPVGGADRYQGATPDA